MNQSDQWTDVCLGTANGDQNHGRHPSVHSPSSSLSHQQFINHSHGDESRNGLHNFNSVHDSENNHAMDKNNNRSPFPLITNLVLPGHQHQRSNSLTSLISRSSSIPPISDRHLNLIQSNSLPVDHRFNPVRENQQSSNLYKLCLSRSRYSSIDSVSSSSTINSSIVCPCGHSHNFPKNPK